MKNVKLSKEEKQLLKAIEAGEFESVLTKNAELNWSLLPKILYVKTNELILEFLIEI